MYEGVSSAGAFESVDFYENVYERDATESHVNIMSDTQNCEAGEMSRPLPVRGGGDGKSDRPERGGPGPNYIAYAFIFLSTIIICTLYKLALSS